MHPLLVLLRIAWRVLPPRLRDRLSVGLFLKMRPHGEPQREIDWRAQGTPAKIGGCQATSFGEEESPAVLLVHGWQGRGLQLGAFIEPLVEAGFRVVAIDMPGHGKTGGKISALPLFDRALQAALKEDHVHAIVAHSLGSSAAILAADKTGWKGRILCLGGPMESMVAFRQYADMVGLPEKSLQSFTARLGKLFDITLDQVDVEAAARRLKNPICAILADEDDDVPVETSWHIVRAARGQSHVMRNVTHRSVMWDRRSIKIGGKFVAG